MSCVKIWSPVQGAIEVQITLRNTYDSGSFTIVPSFLGMGQFYVGKTFLLYIGGYITLKKVKRG